jgi:UDP-galactopyranose mutase
MLDYLIVGAGFSGSVCARQLADAGKRVLVCDKRAHIGGNAYDFHNEHGVLVHQYGPHIFHTNSAVVFDYLSRFTDWREYEHRVLASVDGQLVPFPINLDTINTLYGLELSSFQMQQWLDERALAESFGEIRNSEQYIVSRVGRELYKKFFAGYTRKQWGRDASELDASVAARIPFRTNRDDRYFTDTFQAMPLHGYTRMFENLLDHPNISILLNTDYRDVKDFIPYKELIYTGAIDEFFDYRFGKLPYRSLRFEWETRAVEYSQPVAQINYPNAQIPFTRQTEFKHITGQTHAKTTLCREYSHSEGEPFYPIPCTQNAALYKQYQSLATEEKHVHFAGRLASYKYLNMDQVTAQALTLYRCISAKASHEPSP